MPLKALSNPLILFNDRSPQSIVSLVPSWTASLIDLGLMESIIGITDYCPSPGKQDNSQISRVGSPKNPSVDCILGLKPDLVIANQEENDRTTIEALLAADIPVWLTFPKTVNAMLVDLWLASSLFRSVTAPYQLDILEKSIEWASLALGQQEPVRYFCPIWQDCLENGEQWWMTFNQDTYSNDVLRLLNGKNVFAERKRCYPLQADLAQMDGEEPGERDTRYPRVSLVEILQLAPEVILLPDEPYSYSTADVQIFQQIFSQTPAGQSGKIYPIQGRLIHWPGTILSKTLEECAFLFNSAE